LSDERAPSAGDALLNPCVLGAIAVLIVNDHVFKAAWPGWWTGKLSDFAGALFFPLLIQAAVELGLRAAGKYDGPSRTALLSGIVITALLFIVTELSAAGAAAVASVGEVVFSGSHRLTPDAADLAALVMLVVAYRVGAARLTARRARSEVAAVRLRRAH
jgi:hypothetical protein